MVAAGLTLLAALVLVAIVHRLMRGRAHKLPDALGGAEISPMLDTRLRFLRRVVEAAIIVVGGALALAQFTSLDRLAATVLASSAIAAAVVGFASRQVLANAIAGMVLAVTQPLRIGDLVTFEGETGTVEDVSLTYTWLRTGADETAALAAVHALEETRAARIAEVTDTGLRLQVAGPPVAPAERIAREGELRADVLRALREAGCRGPRDEP